ncbi:MAG: VCBS repeat-containing protein [Phycisphaeraceae bacterium]|nr:MAG: VCBS repeat-containing protein [Phycisphaeraceae bacterium]
MTINAAFPLALALAAGAAADCGPFFAVPVQIAAGPVLSTQIMAKDLDADGVNEILYASRASSGGTGVTVFRRGENGLHQSIQFLPLPSTAGAVQFLVEDVDHDGVLDLMLVEYDAESVRIHRGLGDGTFAPAPVSYAVGPTPTSLAFADLNGDGWEDLVVTNLSAGTISVLMGAGGGVLFPRATYSAGGATPVRIRMTDFNRDGRLDAVVALGNPATLAVLMGNGNGSFQAPRVAPSISPLSARDVVIADFNADGVPDAAFADGSEAFYIYTGRPTGHLVDPVLVRGLEFQTLSNIAAADFNADGLPDIVALTGTLLNPIRPLIYLNQGPPRFAEPLDFGGIGLMQVVAHLDLADMNGDGLTDVLFVDRFGQIGIMVTISGGPVQILTRPQNQTLAPGGTAQLSVESWGAGVQYRWFKDGQPLLTTARVTGVDSPTLTITDVQASDSAVYECRVSNACDAKAVHAFLSVVTTGPECPADFNADGFVDFFDLDAFIEAFDAGC